MMRDEGTEQLEEERNTNRNRMDQQLLPYRSRSGLHGRRRDARM